MEWVIIILVVLALLGSRLAKGCLLGIFWLVILAVAFVLFLTLLIQSDVKDGSDRPEKPRTAIVRTI